MAALALKLTDAGLAAVQGASGSDPVVLSHLGLTATPFDYAPTLTALPGEFKRIEVASGVSAAPNITHLTAYDTSADNWSITGFGLFMSDGVLFAVLTGAAIIMAKAELAFGLMAFDIAFDSGFATNIEYGNAVFAYPPATEEMRGVARIARQERVDAATDGEDDAVTIVTPLTLRARLAALLSSIDAEIAARIAGDEALQEQLPGLADGMTAAAILAKLRTVDGAGSDLDADRLGGFASADYCRIVEQNLAENNGYEVYASGKKVTWGRFTMAENTSVTFLLPTAHSSWVHPVLGISSEQGNTNIQDNTGITGIVTDVEGRPTGVRLWNADDRTVTVWIRTIGV